APAVLMAVRQYGLRTRTFSTVALIAGRAATPCCQSRGVLHRAGKSRKRNLLDVARAQDSNRSRSPVTVDCSSVHRPSVNRGATDMDPHGGGPHLFGPSRHLGSRHK